MSALILRNRFQGNTTLIENDFIDNYMAAANGEYVKVYLLLLRHLNNPCVSLSISQMADCLENTEGDIVRALKYWEKEGLMTLEYDEAQNVRGVEVGRIPSRNTVFSQTAAKVSRQADSEIRRSTPDTIHFQQSDITSQAAAEPDFASPASEPAKSEGHAPARQTVNRKELKQILFVAEQYMGKPLSHTEMESITYFYETLGFSADLIDYLIEYCVENGHKSMAYIQKVALSWADAHITSVEQARNTSALYNKTCYSILNAYGIKGRGPAAPELAFIRRWSETWAFDLEIILEAVARTMKAIHQPGFEYTDRILENWHRQEVHTLNDIQVLDSAFTKEKTNTRKPAKSGRSGQAVAAKTCQFEEHTYNMDELTRNLLQSS
ncbi:DnaD domain protein [Roseburia hominis]